MSCRNRTVHFHDARASMQSVHLTYFFKQDLVAGTPGLGSETISETACFALPPRRKRRLAVFSKREIRSGHARARGWRGRFSAFPRRKPARGGYATGERTRRTLALVRITCVTLGARTVGPTTFRRHSLLPASRSLRPGPPRLRSLRSETVAGPTLTAIEINSFIEVNSLLNVNYPAKRESEVTRNSFRRDLQFGNGCLPESLSVSNSPGSPTSIRTSRQT